MIAMSINNRVTGLSVKNIHDTESSIKSSLTKVSSGKRINDAGDDGAGLSVATRMETDLTSTNQAMRNINDGIALVQTAESALSTMNDILIRFRELSVQAANETYTNADRSMILTEMNQMFNGTTGEFFRIIKNTKFNETKLLERQSLFGDPTLNFQIDKDEAHALEYDPDEVTILIGVAFSNNKLLSDSIASGAASTVSGALTNLGRIDNLISDISDSRTYLGSFQNRLEQALSNNSSFVNNTTTSQSRIIDLDYASETSVLTRNQVRQQAGIAALAQAKNLPESIFSLLR